MTKPRSPFSHVTAGTAMGQLALIAAVPLIARIYTPEDVGRFGVVLAAAQVITIAVSARLQQVLPRVDVELRWPISRALLIAAVVLGPIVAIGPLWLYGQLALPMALATGVLVISFGLFNILNFLVYSEQSFAVIGKMRLVNGGVTAAAQVFGGLISSTDECLVIAYGIGNLAACLLAVPCMLRIRRASCRRSLRDISAQESLPKFAATVGTTALLSNLSLGIPLFGVAAIYGDSVAGSFFLARRLLVLPVQLISSTISDVSYAIVARKTPQQIQVHVRSWLKRLSMLAALVLVAGIVAGPFVSWLVGSDYTSVTAVVILMTFPTVAQLLGSSMANILLALNMELTRLFLNIVKIVLLAAILGIAALGDLSYLTCVACLAVALVAWYLALLITTLYGIARQVRS